MIIIKEEVTAIAFASISYLDITVSRATGHNMWIDNVQIAELGSQTATVVSIPTTGDSVPDEAMIIKDDTVGTGSLNIISQDILEITQK